MVVPLQQQWLLYNETICLYFTISVKNMNDKLSKHWNDINLPTCFCKTKNFYIAPILWETYLHFGLRSVGFPRLPFISFVSLHSTSHWVLSRYCWRPQWLLNHQRRSKRRPVVSGPTLKHVLSMFLPLPHLHPSSSPREISFSEGERKGCCQWALKALWEQVAVSWNGPSVYYRKLCRRPLWAPNFSTS